MKYQPWLGEVLEGLADDPLTKKIKERNNKPPILEGKDFNHKKINDSIKPQHYRKGEVDLYESWYKTYPFNEFRAGMQMIADRYMRRDKENRIQDLDKGIYTLERPKEYEVQHGND